MGYERFLSPLFRHPDTTVHNTIESDTFYAHYQ
jgi:hypothetical protein